MQGCNNNSSALAIELLQSCTNHQFVDSCDSVALLVLEQSYEYHYASELILNSMVEID